MSRYLYSNLLKIIFVPVLMLFLVPSFVYLICSLLIEKHLHIISLILVVSCILLYVVLNVVIGILNKISKNKLFFDEGIIFYNGRTFYTDEVSIRYFKFHISIIEPSLVIPKLHINGKDLSVTCYFSKADIKKLEKLNFVIKRI